MSHPLHDRVPVAVVAKYIRRWLDCYRADHSHEQQVFRGGYYTADNEGSLGILGFQCGISGRTLRLILNDKVMGGSTRPGGNLHPVDHVSFDTADKIVCATAGPLAWHTEEDLIPFYGPLMVTAKEIKQGFELPEGFDFDSLSSAKRYQWSNARMAAAA